jgi:transposase
VLILKEIRGVGYQGGYSVLKELCARYGPKAVRRAHLRFETEPGEQAQKTSRPTRFCLAGCRRRWCASRSCSATAVGNSSLALHADAHFVCSCHVRAFELCGGVPIEISTTE